MALADTITGEIVTHCSPDEARRLTDEIKGAAERVWSLLLEAHERQAWAALGYGTWADYVQAEFDMSRQYAYRLLDQGRVIREIAEAAGVSPMGDTAEVITISEREARDVKPRLKAVTDSIKERITDEATAPEPERVKAIVAEVVAEEREKAKTDAEDRAAVSTLAAQAAQTGFDVDKDSLAERGGWSTACREVTKPGTVSEFLAKHRAHLTERHIAQAERAYEWLDTFLLEVREAK